MQIQRIVRVKNKNYSRVSNFISRNRNISLRARGLYFLVMTLPDDWDFTIAGIVSIIPEGRDAVRFSINELENEGYVTREKIRDAAGIIEAVKYSFYDDPQPVPEDKKKAIKSKKRESTA